MITREEIKRVIPQREPFLFLDEITNTYEDGVDAKCVFNSDNEFFKGHFPDSPLVPGVLLLEAAAQAGAYFLLSKSENKNKNALLFGIDNARFKHMVKPGDVCDIKIRVKTLKRVFAGSTAEISVDGKKAVSCEISCMLVNNDMLKESKSQNQEI